MNQTQVNLLLASINNATAAINSERTELTAAVASVSASQASITSILVSTVAFNANVTAAANSAAAAAVSAANAAGTIATINASRDAAALSAFNANASAVTATQQAAAATNSAIAASASQQSAAAILLNIQSTSATVLTDVNTLISLNVTASTILSNIQSQSATITSTMTSLRDQAASSALTATNQAANATTLVNNLLASNVTHSALGFNATGATAVANGIFLPAANTLGLSTNSIERLRLTAAGNLLLGQATDNGVNILQINGSIRTNAHIIHELTGTGLVRELASGVRHTREYNDAADGFAGITTGTTSEYSMAYNARFVPGGTSILVDTVTTTNLSTTATTTSTALLKAGDVITTTNVGTGTYIVSITNGTTFVMSQAATVTGAAPITFRRYWYRDSSNVGDHAYIRRMNENFEEEVWYAPCAVLGDGIIWNLRSRVQMPAGANFLYGTLTVSNMPVADYDVATKLYVDSTAQGLLIHQQVACATTANITLSGLQAIDGYTTLNGDRVLVMAQANPIDNGVYIAAAGAWARSSDTNTAGLNSTSSQTNMIGAYVFVSNGTTLVNSSWVMSVKPYTLGATGIVWTKFAAAGIITASTGLQKVGNDIQAKLAAGHLMLNGSGQIAFDTNALTTLGTQPTNNPRFTSVLWSRSNVQVDYASNAIQSNSTAGDVGITLHAEGATAVQLKHTRGSNKLTVLDAGGSLARVFAQPDVISVSYTGNFYCDGVWLAIPFNTIQTNNGGTSLSWAGGANITVNENGWYRISFSGMAIWSGAWYNGMHTAIGINGGVAYYGQANYGVYNYYSGMGAEKTLYLAAGTTIQIFSNAVGNAYVAGSWNQFTVERIN